MTRTIFHALLLLGLILAFSPAHHLLACGEDDGNCECGGPGGDTNVNHDGECTGGCGGQGQRGCGGALIVPVPGGDTAEISGEGCESDCGNGCRAAAVSGNAGIAIELPDHSSNSARAFLPGNLADGESAPLIVALHGSGGNASNFGGFLAPIANEAGYFVLAIGSADNRGWAQTDLPAINAAIAAFVDTHPVDTERIHLVGFSAGAGAASLVAINNPVYRGVVAVGGGAYSPEMWQSGAENADYLFLLGVRDPLLGNALQTLEALHAQGASARVELEPGEGHVFPEEWRERIVAFFDDVSRTLLTDRALATATEAIESRDRDAAAEALDAAWDAIDGTVADRTVREQLASRVSAAAGLEADLARLLRRAQRDERTARVDAVRASFGLN